MSDGRCLISWHGVPCREKCAPPEEMIFETEGNFWVIARRIDKTGYISSQSVESNLLLEILKQLKEINRKTVG